MFSDPATAYSPLVAFEEQRACVRSFFISPGQLIYLERSSAGFNSGHGSPLPPFVSAYVVVPVPWYGSSSSERSCC